MTYFVVYVSSASHLLGDDELDAILDQSRRNNERLGVTGAMLYQDGNIMQVLEGDRETVETLYRTIAADRRHSGIIRVLDGTSTGPQFGKWSMAFGCLGSHSSAAGVGTEELLQPEDGHGRTVVRMLLASFRTTLNLHGTSV